jgi:hypothetical protein
MYQPCFAVYITLGLSMLTPVIRFFAFAISCLVATASQAQVIQAVGTLARGKDILEFYEAAIANPQQVLILSSEIQTLFFSSSTRYKDLSNDLAQKVGWFNSGPMGLEHIELKPEPSPSYQYGYYSITLKKLKSKQCELLSNHAALNRNFVRVELNGSPVFANGTQQQTVALCKSQWFFQDGKNELKYVAY